MQKGVCYAGVTHTGGFWDGFVGGNWHRAVDVRDFIQKNYTPYDGMIPSSLVQLRLLQLGRRLRISLHKRPQNRWRTDMGHQKGFHHHLPRGWLLLTNT